MKIAALTMAYRDYEMLDRWCKYYGDQLGRENVFVVSHGHDPKHLEITQGCNLITIPREPVDHFDPWRFEMLYQFAQFLHASYDWVIRTDTDEFIVVDRSVGSLRQMLDQQSKPFVFALGIEVFQDEAEAELTASPITAQRKYGLLWSSYSKTFATMSGWKTEFHGVHFDWEGGQRPRVNMPQGVYLLHMRLCSKAVHEAHSNRKSNMENAPRSWRRWQKREQELWDKISLGPVENSEDHIQEIWENQNNSRMWRFYRNGVLRPKSLDEYNRVVELPPGIVGLV
ncbi:glycosyltransferase family 2 protein [uncultured Ruegeria sp.]|uniref:glycosyltransferase family 2 protein n=1 Tax=uncultured Ruegeria sp. TaxID=259304 RepID=UPI002637CACA|nr:glycosyltransferase family 2 protein [uncultured Ruegeria sp.]